MRSLARFLVTFGCLALVALPAACGERSFSLPSAAPQSLDARQGAVRPLVPGAELSRAGAPVNRAPAQIRGGNTTCVGGTRIYISDFDTGNVTVYCQSGTNQAAIYTISGLSYPQGMWIDSKANLYVVESGLNEVVVYSAKTYKPTGTTLTGTSAQPGAVCGDNKGHVYVPDATANSIDVYTSGSKTSTLTDSNAQYMFFCAVDAKGDLFVDYTNSGGAAHVDEFKSGSQMPTALPIPLTFPGGMRCDKHQHLYVDDPFGGKSASTISWYAAPYTGKGTLVITASGETTGFSFTGTETSLWATNQVALDGQNYSLPAGQLTDSTSNGGLQLPVDVVAFPAGPQ